ncbi:DMT family transporter [Tepidibacter aestuarii]|uniref:DMT family transporter n=1 Tax=Tepidibacter aestuarii TaxID=2925782 RepID=UPI0020C04BBE|nr:DMT family transporter [Tepidibacter aestuarii]CAH2213594.1 Permease of the drug/metabolite transporter (DMT) superfamily [Tepidibacter aestuarii]
MRRQLKADLALLFVTIGWGASFILTKNSLSELETYNFLAIRFLIAFIISSCVFFKNMIKSDKKTIKYGLILGIILYAHYAFQTVGLNYTTASKSAFITGSNVIMVPILSALMIKQSPKRKSLISAMLALIGLAMLTLNENITSINIGDIYTLVCAGVFAIYIIFVGKYTWECESISLAVVQFGVVAFLSAVTSIAMESPIVPSRNDVWMNIIILSVVCTSGAFIIQSVAQKFTTSNHTALIYSAEPVFAAMFGYFLYSEVITIKTGIGAFLILLGMIISEVDFNIFLRSKEKEEDNLINSE